MTAPDPVPFTELPDLAVRTLGGSVVYANDELYAERENLITAAPAVFAPATFGLKGQVYDGWETRRRREPGHDHAIVRLGAAGIIHGVVVDTSFFTGNYPPEVSVEATGAEGFPSPADLAGADWVTLVPRSPAKGDARNTFEVSDPHRYTHVRLSIYPDGGVARLRVHGEVVPDPRFLAGTLDLAAAENGGTITGCSDMFYSSAAHLIAPGRARTMGEGWENARRRDDGNDWVSVRLALPGRIRYAELDTSLFVGNAPGWARLSGSGSGRPVRVRWAHGPGAEAGPGPGAGSGAGSGSGSGSVGLGLGLGRGVVRPAAPDPAAARHPAPLPARGQPGRGRGPAGRLSRRRDGPAPAVGRGRSGRAPGGRRPLARRPAPGPGGHRAGRGRAPGGPRDRHRRRGGWPLGHAARARPGRADPLEAVPPGPGPGRTGRPLRYGIAIARLLELTTRRYRVGFPHWSISVGLDRGRLSRAGSPARYGVGFPHWSISVGLDRGRPSRAGSPARYGVGFPHWSLHIGLDRGRPSRAGSPARYGVGFPHWSISVGLKRGAAEPSWVCCDAGGAPAGAPVPTGSIFSVSE